VRHPNAWSSRLVALAFLLLTAGAHAQPSPSDEAEAKAAMKRGLSAFARRDVETALAEYKKASKLVPDANLPHRYAAEALVELERYEEAIQEYETYLRIKPDVSDAAQIRQRMEIARSKIDGTLDLTSSPIGATVFVDGNSTKVGVTPMSGLKLKRGPHTILFQLSGRKDVTLSPVVRGGEQSSLTADFGDAGASGKTVRDTPKPVESSKGAPTLGWIALGAGAALAGTALVLDLVVLPSSFDSFEDKRRRDDPSTGKSLSTIRTLQVATVIGYAAGGVLAATGVTILLWPRKSEAPVKANIGWGSASLTGRF
jgi:tetratricopeptide (TPR) repeat protein